MSADVPAQDAPQSDAGGGLSALAEALLAPCNDCGHWPGEHHLDTGCKVCRRCPKDMLAVEVDAVERSSWLADRLAADRAARDRDHEAELQRARQETWGAGRAALARGIETILPEHEPVLGHSTLGSTVVGCTCLSARDYRAAGHQAGHAGWRAHFGAAIKDYAAPTVARACPGGEQGAVGEEVS